MQHLEVSGAVRPIYGSLGFKRLIWDRAHSLNAALNDSQKRDGLRYGALKVMVVRLLTGTVP